MLSGPQGERLGNCTLVCCWGLIKRGRYCLHLFISTREEFSQQMESFFYSSQLFIFPSFLSLFVFKRKLFIFPLSTLEEGKWARLQTEYHPQVK